MLISSPSQLPENDSYCKLLLRGNTLTDASPSGRTVTNSGSVSSTTSINGTGLPSGFGKVLNFPGTGYLSAADAADLQMGTLGSVDFWVQIQTITANTCLFEKGYNQGTGILLGANYGDVKLYLGTSLYTATVNWISGGWRHVRLNIADGYAKLYVDDVLTINQATAISFAASGYGLYIGRESGGNWNNLVGQVCNFRVSKGIKRRVYSPQRPY